ncbi:MAG: hypothetical protein ACLR6J_14025 [Parabacteroides merdae]
MRNRLVFPVRDEEGRLAGFAARRLSDEDRDKPKYVNSETGGLYRRASCCTGCMRHGRRSAGRGASFWWKDI